MIMDLLALLMVLGACAAAGIIFTVRRRENERAELRADEVRLVDEQELYAAWDRVHGRSREPLGVDPRERLPI